MIMNCEVKHLDLVNAFIGFCFKIKNWPDFLYRQGYKIYALEWSFKNSEGDEVVPELIAKSNKNNHAILLECKSATCSSDQMEKYNNVTIDDVVQRACVSTANFDFAFLVYENNLGDAKSKIEANGYNFPLLCMGNGILQKVINNFKDLLVNDELERPINFDKNCWPHSFLPFVPSSNFPEKKVAISMIWGLTSLLLCNEYSTINLPTFIEKFIIKGNLFFCFNASEQNRIIGFSKKIIKKIIKNYYSDYISIRKDGRGSEIQPNIYDVIKNPHESTEDNMGNVTKEIKNVEKIANEAISKLKDENVVLTYQSDIGEAIPLKDTEEVTEID